jgi:hypothetical protein
VKPSGRTLKLQTRESDIRRMPRCGESTSSSTSPTQAEAAACCHGVSSRRCSDAPPRCSVAKSRPLRTRAEAQSAATENTTITTLIT